MQKIDRGQVYKGVRPRGRHGTGCVVSVHQAHGPVEPLPWRLDLANHSPTGLEWGYGGSGPAQLALALLAHAVSPEAALENYQRFKWDIVAKLPPQGWELTPADIESWLAAKTKERF